jgi:hypothetical protein
MPQGFQQSRRETSDSSAMDCSFGYSDLSSPLASIAREASVIPVKAERPDTPPLEWSNPRNRAATPDLRPSYSPDIDEEEFYGKSFTFASTNLIC